MLLTTKAKLAWTFSEVLPGTFKRNKADFAHHNYPIIAPLPINGGKTVAIERLTGSGPFIYFVVDKNMHVQYVGKSKEQNVLQRWIRPGIGGPAKHYWTHSTKAGGCVFNIAKGIEQGLGPFHLYYATLDELLIAFVDIKHTQLSNVSLDLLSAMENKLKHFYAANWNIS